MTVYVTKTWGFGSPSGPLQFSQRGWRDRVRGMLREGDLVVIVGTLGDQPDPEERGRILGMMEPTTEVVSALDYDLVRGAQDFDIDGEYKWPFALEIRKAWRFREPRRTLGEMLERRFHMDAAMGIVALSPEEAARILALPRDEVPLLQSVQALARLEGDDVARRRGAPPPTTTRTGVMHLRRAAAFTYAMTLERTDQSAFKIGWAFDWKARQDQFNQASLPSIGGIRYRIAFKQLWASAREAFRMEQTLLREFDRKRYRFNREVILPVEIQELEAAWVQYIANRRRRRL